ncbi:MAG: lysylphosphatidylglycerol synthase transmembrane domain-containing protein [Alphaproteobacteria bacterium]|nr:lysylphosphatidylglycerol synthase transmembrane domain-containing protein [Alphaproteobacteria bacterium]
MPLSPAQRKGVFTALKIAVTLALFWLIASKLDLSDITARLRSADPVGLCAATALIFVQLVLNSERWRRLLQMDHVTLPYRLSFRFYLEAMFFNQALPGAVGGDVMRVYRVKRFCASVGQAVTSVLLDRITGLIGLCVLIAIGLPMLIQRTGDQSILTGFLLIGLAGLIGIGAVILIARQSEQGWGGRIREFIVRLSRLFVRLISHPRDAVRILSLALGTHLTIVLTAYISAQALGLPFSYGDCLIIVPTSILIATLPISLGGWGVREGAMAAGFALIGGDAGGAVALSIVMGLEILTVGLIGGIVWFLSGATRVEADALTLVEKGE